MGEPELCEHLCRAARADPTSGLILVCRECGLWAAIHIGELWLHAAVRRPQPRRIPWRTRRDPAFGLDFNQSRAVRDVPGCRGPATMGERADSADDNDVRVAKGRPNGANWRPAVF